MGKIFSCSTHLALLYFVVGMSFQMKGVGCGEDHPTPYIYAPLPSLHLNLKLPIYTQILEDQLNWHLAPVWNGVGSGKSWV